MTRTPFVAAGLSALAVLIAAGCPARGQDIRWRYDYAAARREASATGKPLLLDFGTEACVWCRKLDATTFRDPRVVQLVNERFVPVKIDGNRNPRLVEALEIEAYPTLILATPAGKVVGRHSGYLDATQMLTFLAQAPAPAPPTDPPTAAAPRPAASPAAVGPAPSGRPTDPVAVAPIRPSTTEAERRRLREQIEADLATLARQIAADLDR